MSLINDALKRAKQAQAENPATPPDLPLRPAEPSPPRSSGLPLLPLAALIVALVLGGGFIFMALQKWNANPEVVHAAQADAHSASPAATTPPETPAAATTAATPVAPSTPVKTVGSQAQAVSTLASNSPSDSAADSTVALPKPELPKLVVPKLQGIFYNPGRPSAVVSGRTVYVGSRVGETRELVVLGISRESVTVGNGSQTNVLVLED